MKLEAFGRKRMYYLTEWYTEEPGAWTATWEPRLIDTNTVKTPLKILTAYRLHNHAQYDASPPGLVDKDDLPPDLYHCFPPWDKKWRPPVEQWSRLMGFAGPKEYHKAVGKKTHPGDPATNSILGERKDTYSWDPEECSYALLKPKPLKKPVGKTPKAQKPLVPKKPLAPKKPSKSRLQQVEELSSEPERPLSPDLAPPKKRREQAAIVLDRPSAAPPIQAPANVLPVVPQPPQPPQPQAGIPDRNAVLFSPNWRQELTRCGMAHLIPRFATIRSWLAVAQVAVVQEHPQASVLTGPAMLALMQGASVFAPQEM